MSTATHESASVRAPARSDLGRLHHEIIHAPGCTTSQIAVALGWASTKAYALARSAEDKGLIRGVKGPTKTSATRWYDADHVVASPPMDSGPPVDPVAEASSPEVPNGLTASDPGAAGIATTPSAAPAPTAAPSEPPGSTSPGGSSRAVVALAEFRAACDAMLRIYPDADDPMSPCPPRLADVIDQLGNDLRRAARERDEGLAAIAALGGRVAQLEGERDEVRKEHLQAKMELNALKSGTTPYRWFSDRVQQWPSDATAVEAAERILADYAAVAGLMKDAGIDPPKWRHPIERSLEVCVRELSDSARDRAAAAKAECDGLRNAIHAILNNSPLLGVTDPLAFALLKHDAKQRDDMVRLDSDCAALRDQRDEAQRRNLEDPMERLARACGVVPAPAVELEGMVDVRLVIAVDTDGTPGVSVVYGDDDEAMARRAAEKQISEPEHPIQSTHVTVRVARAKPLDMVRIDLRGGAR